MNDDQINRWKTRLDNLKLQMHLGAAEAGVEYEKQKKNLKKWSDESLREIEHLQTEGKAEFKKLKNQLEELKLQAALGKADASDVLREQQKNLNKKLQEVKSELSGIKKSTEAKAENFARETDQKLQDFQSQFDMFRIQMNLGKAEALDYWNEQKKVISAKISEMDRKLDKYMDKADVKLDSFSEEMNQAWDHIKKAFK